MTYVLLIMCVLLSWVMAGGSAYAHHLGPLFLMTLLVGVIACLGSFYPKAP